LNFFSRKNMVLIIGDVIIAFFSVYVGMYLRYIYGQFQIQDYNPVFPRAIAFAFFIVLMCFFMDVYLVEKKDRNKDIFFKILFSTVFASFLLAAFYYFFPYIYLGRGVLVFTLIISIILQFVWHMIYSLILKLPAVGERVLIIGTGTIANTIGTMLTTSHSGYALAGYVSCAGEPMIVSDKDVVGNGEGLLSTAMEEGAQKIVVSLGERRGALPVRQILDCKLRGIDIVDGASFYETIMGKLFIEDMKPSHLIFSEGFRLTLFRSYVKRGLDVTLSIIGILFAIPLFVIIPILIRINSPGTVLFKQKRVGVGEKEFTVLKFRTMVQGAEKNSGPVWSEEGDVRITKVGKWLRKTRIDEIPQLFNVLRGDMSFIGPRPERPFFVETLKKQIPYYSERHCMKPGITGWAQVRHEYGDSVDDALEKLRYDLYYIKYQSLALDLLIILDTVKVVFFGRGGR